MSRSLVLFGTYRGTVRKQGFFWTNPFTCKTHVSLKANNVASETIKVNDLGGNPIEIGAIVVWRVRDTLAMDGRDDAIVGSQSVWSAPNVPV